MAIQSNSTFPTSVGGPSAASTVVDLFSGGEPQHSDALTAIESWIVAADAIISTDLRTTTTSLGTATGVGNTSLKLGWNTVTCPAGATGTLALPTGSLGDKVYLLATQGATGGTWAFATGTGAIKKAGGSFALSTGNSKTDYVEFVYTGSFWQATVVDLATA